MSEAGRQRERRTHAGAARRLADHAGIARLTEELLPALIAKLSTTQLGELEVREGDWIVRLRRPPGTDPGAGRRASDRPSRAQTGQDGHGHGRAAVDGHRSARSASTTATSGVTAGTGAASASSNGNPGTSSSAARDGEATDRSREIALSPAVGTFKPGPRATSGTRVRAGDSLGTVDMLGIPQDIVAPADGIVGQTLVEPGMAVEYGQELIRLELTLPAETRGARAGDS